MEVLIGLVWLVLTVVNWLILHKFFISIYMNGVIRGIVFELICCCAAAYFEMAIILWIFEKIFALLGAIFPFLIGAVVVIAIVIAIMSRKKIFEVIISHFASIKDKE